ncbi:unnamed protein product, partial [Didymodactylos carnosus]
YGFEFFGLTLFCSESNNRDVSYQWFVYTVQHLPTNSLELLTNAIENRTNDWDCVQQYVHYIKANFTKTVEHYCPEEQIMEILGRYFDSHDRFIVRLIQQIQRHSFGFTLSRNEIRVKYHYHACIFKQNPNQFSKLYNFIYGKMIGFNRYTLILSDIKADRCQSNRKKR